MAIKWALKSRNTDRYQIPFDNAFQKLNEDYTIIVWLICSTQPVTEETCVNLNHLAGETLIIKTKHEDTKYFSFFQRSQFSKAKGINTHKQEKTKCQRQTAVIKPS